jgi:hypothetical protein
VEGVWGTVNYLAPGSVRNRLYVAPGDQRATARYEPHRVFIANGRAHRDDLTLDAAGFTLVDHSSAVRSLDNPAMLDGGYTGEARALVRALTGAAHVVSLGWILRRTTADRGGALPPAPDVHVDLHSTEIAHRYTRVHAQSDLPAPGTFRRAVWTLVVLPRHAAGRGAAHQAARHDHSIAWRAPHTSFRDTSAAGASPRESVELRTVAYFR